MHRNILLSVVVAGLLSLGISGTAAAGIEPVPWKPEMNKLDAMERQLDGVENHLGKLDLAVNLPTGTANHLEATVNHLKMLDARLGDVLIGLPITPYAGRDDVILTLDGIGMAARGSMDLFEDLYSRLGVEPSPWREVLASIIARATAYIDAVCTPGTPCPPGH